MNDDTTVTSQRCGDELTSTHPVALRCQAAIRNGRLDDARRHALAMVGDTATEQAWRMLLLGLVSYAERDCATAEAYFLQAAGFVAAQVPVTGESVGGEADLEAKRLLACAWEHAGRAIRRQERPALAEALHAAAYRLRERLGSWCELWETAVSLGLDAAIARRFSEAEAWLRRSLVHAAQLADARSAAEATSWTHLACVFLEAENRIAAVDAAREAQRLWSAAAPDGLEPVRADILFARAQLKLVEQILSPRAAHEHAGADPLGLLEEAIERLRSAGESLAAFGSGSGADARLCSELEEFAIRLRASLSSAAYEEVRPASA